MVAAVSSTPNSKVSSRGSSPAPAKPKRAPLLPSESDINGHPLPRRPEYRDVTSRYLAATATAVTATASSNPTTNTMTSSSSSSSSTTTTLSLNSPRKRLVSANHLTPASPVNNKRYQSVERHYSGNSRTGEMSASAKMLTKMSARSLSVSFQGESFALPVSKVEKPANNRLRNGTPERRKTVAPPARTSENSNPIDKQRRPEKSRQGNFMSMSVDFTNEKMEFSLPKSMAAIKTVNKHVSDSDHAISDTDSNVGGGGRRAIAVPARFWQETINLLRRVQPEPVSPSASKSNKLISDDGPKLTSRGAIPPALPSKRWTPSSPMRNTLTLGCNNNLGNTPSILSFSVDSRSRGGKVGEKKLVDAHVLRLMHNKHLQWRFANAKVDAAMLVQQATAKKSLYNAWVTISKMWHSVVFKRIEMQQLKQNLKLHSILKKQMSYLDNWDLTDKDHSISLAGAIGALESSALCLPVLCGAKADVQNLKDAICSAFDVMQAIAVSICSLATKVEHVNLLASELASAMISEFRLLDQCKDLFTTLTLMEVQDLSLRTHTLQLMPTNTTDRKTNY